MHTNLHRFGSQSNKALDRENPKGTPRYVARIGRWCTHLRSMHVFCWVRKVTRAPVAAHKPLDGPPLTNKLLPRVRWYCLKGDCQRCSILYRCRVWTCALRHHHCRTLNRGLQLQNCRATHCGLRVAANATHDKAGQAFCMMQKHRCLQTVTSRFP